jgi:hypothetical protein
MSDKQKMIGEEKTTGRGFSYVEFKDTHDHTCSLQESSRAVCESDDGSVDDPLGWLWLGIDDPEPEIMQSDANKLGLSKFSNPVGWTPYKIPNEVLIHTRMHLNEAQVRGLIARLQHWLDTGELYPR